MSPNISSSRRRGNDPGRDDAAWPPTVEVSAVGLAEYLRAGLLRFNGTAELAVSRHPLELCRNDSESAAAIVAGSRGLGAPPRRRRASLVDLTQ